MSRSLRAELVKLATTRAIHGILVGELAVVLLATASTVASAGPESLRGSIHAQVFFLLASINVGIFSLIIGMRTVTDEYRHSTIAHAFLSDPGRSRTITAKAAAAAVTAAVLAAGSLALMTAVGTAVAGAKGGALTFTGSGGAFAGFVLANAVWAVIGVGIGAVVRHQVPAIVGGIVWVLVVENLGAGFLGDAGAYLPGQSAYALARALQTPGALAVPAAAVVMALYAATALSLGLASTRRRDVA